MHEEAYEGFGWALRSSGLSPESPLRILDIGGQDVNGTVHDYFTHPETTITTLDIENADIIADARTWKPDRLFDVVIATEVFEHVQGWEAILRTAYAALAVEGPGILLTTCASTGRKPHGATGAEHPAPGEWYENVDPQPLLAAILDAGFEDAKVRFREWPGDAYAWASLVKRPFLPDVTMIIPSIPPRAKMLHLAEESALAQTHLPEQIKVLLDTDREGPAAMRNRGLREADTEWVAFLDDDDVLYPEHLDACLARAMRSGADLVYPWYDLYVLGQKANHRDPLRLNGQNVLGQPFDDRAREEILTRGNFVPITVIVRREALLEVGGFPTPGTEDWPHPECEDWGAWQRLLRAGAVFAHEPRRTWRWNMHGQNTSGRVDRWR